MLSAPRSPWQRAYVERVIGTIRRECLDHVIVFNEASLYRHVKLFTAYYHDSRTHLSLAKDTPEPRPVQPVGLGTNQSHTAIGRSPPSVRATRSLKPPGSYPHRSRAELCSFAHWSSAQTFRRSSSVATRFPGSGKPAVLSRSQLWATILSDLPQAQLRQS